MALLTVTIAQKRAVAQALEGVGFNIGNFIWVSQPSQYQYGQPYVDRIVLKGTPYFFQFDRGDQGGLWAYHCPGSDIAIQSQRTRTWESQFRTFCEWANLLLEEVREPDPWERVKVFLPDDSLFEDAEGNNSPFSYAEVEHISAALTALQLKMEQRFSLTEGQLRILRQGIEYLKEQAKKQGRVNWKQLFIGTIVTLALKLALPSDARQIVWDLVKESFGAIRSLVLR